MIPARAGASNPRAPSEIRPRGRPRRSPARRARYAVVGVPSVSLRFYGPLNDFLAPELRQREQRVELGERASIKDVIESRGVPHPEVELVLVNGERVTMAYVVHDGDRVSVHPRLITLDPRDPGELRFVLDGHLGRLAAYLRALGFDTAYDRHADDEQLALRSRAEQRVLLTRDIGLLKRSIVRDGYWLRSTRPAEQLRELDARYALARRARPFSRCLRDNALLVEVDKSAVLARLPPRTRQVYQRFYECPECHRLFWRGSHHDHLLRLFERTLRGRLTAQLD